MSEHGSVEAEGATVDEAVAAALAELEANEDRVEIEVLTEGRKGLFGGRKARVRVTRMEDQTSKAQQDAPDPTAAAPAAQEPASSVTHEEEHVSDDTTTVDETTEDGAAAPSSDEEISPETRVEQLDEEADLAADFVEGLLDRLDLPGDIEIEVNEDQAFVTVQDVGSGLLIGRRGATLDALQELVRCAIQRQTERRSHVRVDVEGYRARQLDKLRDKCRDAIAEVREAGEPVRLEPMDAYERKMMHDLVAKTGGVTSSSEGNEPRRRVVIHPED